MAAIHNSNNFLFQKATRFGTLSNNNNNILRKCDDEHKMILLASALEEGCEDLSPNPGAEQIITSDDASSVLRNAGTATATLFQKIIGMIKDEYKNRPPIQADDTEVLLYDVFLLVNLVVCISIFIVHRFDFQYLGAGVSEGCLLSCAWIAAGLYTGAFLYSAVDGHHPPGDERAGPQAACLLAVQTFVNAINLRLVFALCAALAGHRAVGASPGEQLLPLEIGFGLVMMAAWRTLHSSYVPR